MMNIIHKIKIIFLQRLSLLLIAGSLFLFSDCKRTSEDMELLGSEYVSAPAGFYVNGNSFTATWANTFPINFWVDSVKFNAGFSHNVTWTITITGAESGAVKQITGLSNSLNNIYWNGNSSNIYFFKKAENIIAVLSFLGSSLTYSDTITINKTKKYDGKIINGVNHILLDDFDGNVSGRNLTGQFKDLGDGSTNTLEASSNIKVEGNYSFHLAGTDFNSNTWLSGINTDPLTSFKYTATGTPTTIGITATDPNEIYFNIYVYSTGKESSSIQLKVYELDGSYSATYDQTINDGYVYDIFLNWTGWKLISARYSDFKRASDPLYGGNGNGIKEPLKICGMALGLNSNPLPAKEVEAYVDFLILTERGRFIP